MVSIPLEVIVNILCRLPVKPLKRFRSVAKSWRSLIDNNKFVKLHLKRSLETNSHRCLIAVAPGVKDVFKVHLGNGDPVNVTYSVIKPPFSNCVNGDGNLHYCNGLFLVSGEPIVMWNPFTTECKRLPQIVDDDFPVPLGCSSKIVCGFVWDSRSDDYKVVRVLQHLDLFRDSWIASRAHVYSLKSNSWRETVEFTYPIFSWLAVVNGALHTMVYNLRTDTRPVKIMAFNVVRERHYEVKLPQLDNIWESKGLSMAVHTLGGCLSMSVNNKSGTAIWVMKDYRVRSSWTKMVSIPMKIFVDELHDKNLKPLVYTNDGHKVLLSFCFKTYFWQDLRNQSSVPIKGLPRKIDYAVACVESLVSFHSEQVPKQMHDQDKEEDEKKIRNKRDDVLSTGFKLVL